MKSIQTYQTIYFIGIGGIGMSALARYFKKIGKQVEGYDKTQTPLTGQLIEEGIQVHFVESNPRHLDMESTLVIYTPAIPVSNSELQYVNKEGFTCVKRAQALGLLTKEFNCLAVAGTHGKTTTSTMLAHIFESSGRRPNAFLGGISSNYNTNLLMGDGDIVVVEADEYDRSFMTLSPNTAIVTSVEADHLDIYGDGNALQQSFLDFMSLVPIGGNLIVKYGLPTPSGSLSHTYGFDQNADLSAQNVRVVNGVYEFDLHGMVEVKDLSLGMAGLHNVENALAACLAALLNGIEINDIKSALRTFNGVKRRFEYCIRKENLVYIDDYAHHPTELEQCIKSVKQMYPDKKITGVFQPHLFSRTRDFADGFALSLGLLDALILLEIYPARELPIEGVSSRWLLDKINLKDKMVCSKDGVIDELIKKKPEVLLTLGAGDIDQLVEPIVKHLI